MWDMFFKLGGRALPKGPRISAWLETPACISQIRKVVPANRPGNQSGICGHPQGDYTLGMGIQYLA